MNVRKLMTCALAFTVMVSALVLPAWADLPRPDPAIAEFARGVKFTVAGYTGTEVLTNFPVLVRLSESTIDGFHYSDFTRADYKDLCFVDMQTNGLPCEVDTWNASGESLVWVTLPRVTNGTEFVMWYHSSSPGSLVCDKTAWGDYAGVWHMNETGDSTVTISDATTNHLDATTTSGSYAAVGRIGGARTPTKAGSSKNTERIEVGLDSNAKRAVVDGVNTAADHAFTVSMWIKPMKYSSFDGPNAAYLMGRKTQDSDQYWGIQFHYVNDTIKSPYYNYFRVWRNEKDNTNNWKPQFADSVIPDAASSCYGNWYKLDVVYSGTTAYFYVNGGGAAGSCLTNVTDHSPAHNATSSNGKLFLTGTSVSSKARPFRGDLDEFRLRAGAMSADWVKADFDTVNNVSFLSAGEVESVTVKEMPFAGFGLLDSGAAFATFSSVITSLGDVEGGATLCDVYYKVWKSAESEPNEWTLLRSGVSNINVVFTNSVTGLTTGTAYSWKLYAENNLGDATEEIGSGSFTTSGAGVAGVGGETYRVKDDYVHRFTVDEDTTSYEFTPPSYVTTLRALIVAGGGPGGYDRGGGGGAGGLVYDEAFALPAGATYTINVGTGGVASASADAYGVNGGDSSIVGGSVNLVVYGGGAGGNAGDKKAGVDGGSGGGSAADKGAVGKAKNNSAQGHNGGQGVNFTFYNAGGGGGAAELGGDAPSAGATFGAGGGGSGFLTNISGENAYYAGGGGGGTAAPQSGKVNNIGRGGDGGGGDGGSSTAAATAGQDNLGGGGGGGHANCPGANGGSGVVILRYSVQGDGQGMTEPAIALESLDRNEDNGLTKVVYRVAWAGDGYDYADVAIVWGFRKDNLSHTNEIATGVIGRGMGAFTLPEQSRTVYVRALATNAVAGALSTEIVKVPFINPDAPTATVSATHGITTAGFEADVTSLGGSGATRVEGVFQVCTDEYFEDGTYLTFPVTNGTLTAVGVLKGAATGLSAHTTYFVRASLTNNFDAVLETEPFEFRTSQVDWPSGQIQPSNDSPSFTVTTNSISATFYFTDLGEGAASGSCWLEVSTTSDFATITASSSVTNVVAADIPATCNFTVEGLEPDTVYYVRYRVRNNGGRETSNERQWAFTTLTPPPPPVTLTIPELPANVTLVSVTTNGVAVTGNAGVYTILSNATVTITFAAAEGYMLVGDTTVDVVMNGNTELAVASIPNAEQNPDVVAPSVSPIAAKISPRKTVTLTASAAGATSYIWLKNGVQIEGGTSGTLTVNWRKPNGNPIDTYQAVAVYSINDLPVESEPSARMTVENLPMGTIILVVAAPPAPPAEHDYSADYLTFRVLTSGTISWKSFGNVTKTIEYSIDNGAWTSITSTSEGVTISVVQGNLVRFRGSNTFYATDKSNYSGFEGGTATYDIEGNIMSLLDGDNFAESTTFQDNSYIFCSLFKKAPVISAENLILPATTLKEYCYRALFSLCTTLTKAPKLPATTLSKGCYWYMFEQCSITEAPVLNATTLVNECYGHMFEGCGLLNKITCLATSGFGTSKCLEGWVKNVAGDGAFVKAANTTWTTGDNGIPTGWIVCEDVLLLPPEVSFFGDTIELECPTEGAEIRYRLGQTGDFAPYTQPISIAADAVVEAYSTYQNHTSPTVSQTCVYVHETPFERSNKDLTTWRYNGNTITTPYSVNGIDGHSSGYAKGTFAFDTSITLREAQPTYLWFQHADQSADIYVDDVKVATHWGGYNAFFVDISEYVHRGKNDIRVALCNTTRNTLAPAAGDFNFNATLGNVKLFTSPVLPAMKYGYDGFHITSTVSASSATTNATINVETEVPAGASLKCIISDDSYAWTNTVASEGRAQTFTTTIAGSDLKLWNGTKNPHLYTVTLEIYKDGELYHRYQRPYGFRYYEYVINETVNGETYTGFLLNGEPYLLRGVCMHDDVEGKANALTDSDYDQEFAIIQELGCNFIRLAHYPHPKEVYDRCDQLGIIVQTEVPCVNKLQSTMPSDYYTHLETQYIEMVEQHYNHPCIMFWGLSNETTTDDKAFGKEKIEGYYDLIKSMDTERMVGYVMSHSYNNPSGYYNNPDVDWFGCNLYVGWYIDKTINDPSSQLNTRIKNTITDRSKPLALSEYGCGGTQHCHSTNFLSTTTTGNNPRHDIEYQMWLHEGHIAAIRNYPQLLFTGQWQLFDIAVANRTEGYTECLDGENATTNDELKRLNNKGLVERDHVTKKDTFYIYKAEWNSKDKFVHICGKDYTKTTDRALKCYTNDGDTLSMYIGNSETPFKTANVVDHIAEFEATDFPSGVEIRVTGATTSDTVTFQ